MNSFLNIPQELRERSQWLVWKYEQVEGKAKPAKVPRHAKTLWNIDPTQKHNLCSFDAAVNAVTMNRADGIGFSFQPDDPYCGIDLDATNDPVLAKVQLKIKELFQSYTEQSPSGKGEHIIVKGSVPEGINASGIEVYSKERYFTFTGEVTRNLPFANGADTQNKLDILWAQLRAHQQSSNPAPVELPDVEQTKTDDEVCALAEKASDGKFGEIYTSTDVELVQLGYRLKPDGSVDGSTVDLAFLNYLTHFTQNAEQLKRIFKVSARGATLSKRKPGHITKYLETTIKRALDQYQPEQEWLKPFIAAGQAIVDARRTKRLEAEHQRQERARQTRLAQAEEMREKIQQQISTSKNEHDFSFSDSPFSFAPPVAKGDYLPIPPGQLGLLYEYLMEQSPYAIDGICMGAAITFAATICGRAHNVSGEGLNTYVLSLATTSAGKEGGISGISKLINRLSIQFRHMEHMIKPRQPNSAGGLINDLAAESNPSKSLLYCIDEFWSHFANLSGVRASAHDKALKSAYMEFYTKSGYGKRAGGSSYSDRTKNVPTVDAPNLNLFGFSVPGKFYESLDEENFTDGFMPRFVIFECDNIPVEDNESAHLVEPGNELIGMLTNMAQRSQIATRGNTVVDVQFDVDALIKLNAYKLCVRKWFLGDEHVKGNVWSRAHMKVLKLASILAVADACAVGNQDAYSPLVTMAHVDWALTIVNTTAARLEARLLSGEFGQGDMKAISDAKRYLTRYVTESKSSLAKSHFDARMHADKIINLSHLKTAVSTSSFRKAQGGAIRMWQMVVVSLMAEGVLIKMQPEMLTTKYQYWGEAFGVSASALDNGG